MKLLDILAYALFLGAILCSPAAFPQKLSKLCRMLETSRITEAEFNVRQKELLDRLDRAYARESGSQHQCFT